MSQQPPGQAPTDFNQPMAGESPLWFSRFVLYRDLPPGARTVLAAYQASGQATTGAQAVQKAPGPWRSAAARFAWKARAQAFDQHGQDIAQDIRAQVIRQDTTAETLRQLRDQRRRLQEEDEWKVRNQLLAKGMEMLDTSLFRRKSEDGSVVVQPSRWSFWTASRLLELGLKLGRLSTRMPVQPEPDRSSDPEMTFFTTSGEVAEALPPNVVPEMPAHCDVKPEIGNLKAGAAGGTAPQQPRVERPSQPR